MGVIRAPKYKDFTTMTNHHLKDKRLSLKAKGIMSLILSLPDNWDYSFNGLVALCVEGETVLRTTLKELKGHGYLEIVKAHRNGRIDYDYNIYEKPIQYSGFLHTEILHTEILNTENHTQLNTNKSNTKQSNTKQSNNLVQQPLDDASVVPINIDETFEKSYARYPRREGKTKGKQLYMQYLKGREIKGQGKVKFNHNQMHQAIQEFAFAMEGRETDKIKLFSTFMGSDIIDYVERTKAEYIKAMKDRYGDGWEKIKYRYGG